MERSNTKIQVFIRSRDIVWKSYYSVFYSLNNQFLAAVNVEFIENIPQMGFDSKSADKESLGYFHIIHPLSH
jgi:hypothetical protein